MASNLFPTIANFFPLVKSVLLVEMRGFEPLTYALQRHRSPAELHPRSVGLMRLEHMTSRLSGVRSNQLSYRPA